MYLTFKLLFEFCIIVLRRYYCWVSLSLMVNSVVKIGSRLQRNSPFLFILLKYQLPLLIPTLPLIWFYLMFQPPYLLGNPVYSGRKSTWRPGLVIVFNILCSINQSTSDLVMSNFLSRDAPRSGYISAHKTLKVPPPVLSHFNIASEECFKY